MARVKFNDIKIALYDQPTDKGLFVNNSSASSLELFEWLPERDAVRTPEYKWIQLVVKMKRICGRGTKIILG